jgi:hypothetical protein
MENGVKTVNGRAIQCAGLWSCYWDVRGGTVKGTAGIEGFYCGVFS